MEQNAWLPIVSKRQPHKGAAVQKATSSVLESQFTFRLMSARLRGPVGCFRCSYTPQKRCKSAQWSHLKPDVGLMSNTAFLLLQWMDRVRHHPHQPGALISFHALEKTQHRSTHCYLSSQFSDTKHQFHLIWFPGILWHFTRPPPGHTWEPCWLILIHVRTSVSVPVSWVWTP